MMTATTSSLEEMSKKSDDTTARSAASLGVISVTWPITRVIHALSTLTARELKRSTIHTLKPTISSNSGPRRQAPNAALVVNTGSSKIKAAIT